MRYAPHRPFPSYAFLPGRSPHPTSDPKGHSYKRPPEKTDLAAPEDWRRCETYLYGVDLFNYGYCWEAHETWEFLWHKAGRGTEQGNFLQGLIQVAAGLLKLKVDQPAGAESLFTSARALLEPVREKHPRYMGLDLERFLAEMAKSPVIRLDVKPV